MTAASRNAFSAAISLRRAGKHLPFSKSAESSSGWKRVVSDAVCMRTKLVCGVLQLCMDILFLSFVRPPHLMILEETTLPKSALSLLRSSASSHSIRSSLRTDKSVSVTMIMRYTVWGNGLTFGGCA